MLERQPFDVKKVFGANSDQAKETGGNQTNDFIGVAVHCALNCSQQNNAVADMLPDELGSYTGYQALFGMKYVAPALGGFTVRVIHLLPAWCYRPSGIAGPTR